MSWLLNVGAQDTQRERYDGGGMSRFCAWVDFMQILDVGLYVCLYVCSQYYFFITAVSVAKSRWIRLDSRHLYRDIWWY